MRLLLLEDDTTLGEGLRAYLEGEGHVVDWCTTLGAARLLQDDPFDALLVDWQLPDGSGVDWVRSLRQRQQHVPVIVLTARDLLSDRIRGLDSGADDYLVKPFEPEELAARLRAVCRRQGGNAGPLLQFGPVSLDLPGRTARLHGLLVELTPREWQVLEALALRAGRTVGKSDLEALVLGLDGDINSNALEVHISSIRRKLGRELIETARGIGYRIPS